MSLINASVGSIKAGSDWQTATNPMTGGSFQPTYSAVADAPRFVGIHRNAAILNYFRLHPVDVGSMKARNSIRVSTKRATSRLRLCAWRSVLVNCALAFSILVTSFVAPAFFQRPAHAKERIPVVFVPGFMGSKLEDDKGVLWGDMLQMVMRLEDLTYKGQNTRNHVRATEVLRGVQLAGVYPVEGYQKIFDFFKRLEFKKNRDLFLFAYDWRRSNLHNARELAAFVERTPALKNRRFNIVAHSMGGVLASNFLSRHGSSAKVKYFITVGTPHLGSADVLANVLRKYTSSATGLAILGNEQVFLKAFLSFPSLYEQLPYDTKACRIAGNGKASFRPCNVFKPSFWANAKLPKIVRRALPPDLPGYLDNVRKLKQDACAPQSSGPRMFRFAGIGVDTIDRITLNLRRGFSITVRHVSGDGVITEFSASCDNPAETEVYHDNHLGILDNPRFQSRLCRILLGNGLCGKVGHGEGTIGPPSTTQTGPEGRDASRLPRSKRMTRGSLALHARYVRPGDSITAEVKLHRPDRKPLEGEIVSAVIRPTKSEASREIPVNETAPGVYRITGQAGMTPGIYRLQVNIPGATTLLDYVAVLKEAPASPVRKQDLVARTPFQVLLSSPNGRARVSMPRANNRLSLIARANRDTSLYCFFQDRRGVLYKIFPADKQQNATIPANTIRTISVALPKTDSGSGAGNLRCYAADRNVTAELPAALDFNKPGPVALPYLTDRRLKDIFETLPKTSTSIANLQINDREVANSSRSSTETEASQRLVGRDFARPANDSRSRPIAIEVMNLLIMYDILIFARDPKGLKSINVFLNGVPLANHQDRNLRVRQREFDYLAQLQGVREYSPILRIPVQALKSGKNTITVFANNMQGKRHTKQHTFEYRRPKGTILPAAAFKLFAPDPWSIAGDSGRLVLQAQPQTADIYINDNYQVGGFSNTLLEPGRYRLRIEKDGYKRYVGDFRIRKRSLTHLKIPLEKLPSIRAGTRRNAIKRSPPPP